MSIMTTMTSTLITILSLIITITRNIFILVTNSSMIGISMPAAIVWLYLTLHVQHEMNCSLDNYDAWICTNCRQTKYPELREKVKKPYESSNHEDQYQCLSTMIDQK